MIINNDIKAQLESVLGQSSGKELQLKFYCPFCNHHKKKLEVNLENNVYNCWICDKSGSLYNLFKKNSLDTSNVKNFKTISEDSLVKALDALSGDKKSVYINKCVQIPDTYRPLSRLDKSLNFKKAYKYLFQRNLSVYDVIKYNIHFDTENYNILIPSYDNNGNLNYTFIRSMTSSFKVNSEVSKKDITFNELFIDWSEPIILTEGVFDAITAGNNSIPLLGSALNDDYYLFKQLTKYKPDIFLALDFDAREKQNKIAKLLYSYGLKVYTVDLPKDKDINELGYEKFNKYKRTAKLYTEMSILLSVLENL